MARLGNTVLMLLLEWPSGFVKKGVVNFVRLKTPYCRFFIRKAYNNQSLEHASILEMLLDGKKHGQNVESLRETAEADLIEYFNSQVSLSLNPIESLPQTQILKPIYLCNLMM